jgi:hypothetical protein
MLDREFPDNDETLPSKLIWHPDYVIDTDVLTLLRQQKPSIKLALLKLVLLLNSLHELSIMYAEISAASGEGLSISQASIGKFGYKTVVDFVILVSRDIKGGSFSNFIIENQLSPKRSRNASIIVSETDILAAVINFFPSLTPDVFCDIRKLHM